jgi:hypothetical protein
MASFILVLICCFTLSSTPAKPLVTIRCRSLEEGLLLPDMANSLRFSKSCANGEILREMPREGGGPEGLEGWNEECDSKVECEALSKLLLL